MATTFAEMWRLETRDRLFILERFDTAIETLMELADDGVCVRPQQIEVQSTELHVGAVSYLFMVDDLEFTYTNARCTEAKVTLEGGEKRVVMRGD